MSPFIIALVVFLVLALVFFMILVIVQQTTRKLYYVDITPTMNDLYRFGNAQDNIQYKNNVKPFSIRSSSQMRKARNAFVFNNVNDFKQHFTDNRIVGFQFQMIAAQTVTALQYINQLSNQIHSVAIYDVLTSLELTDPLDRVVNAATDPVDDYGFVTHVLTTPILLAANKSYIIVTTVTSDDSFLDSTDEKVNVDAVTQKNSYLTIESAAFTAGATAVNFPTTFTGPLQYFVSFVFRPVPVLAQVFDVNMVTGGAPRYPPKYISGFNVSVRAGQSSNVLIGPGVASAYDNVSNLTLTREIVLSNQVGRNGLDEGIYQVDQFYYVYVCGSQGQGLPTMGLLSLDRSEPMLPIGYDCYRRVGAVRSTTSIFEPCVQEGSGISRTMYYTSGTSAYEIGSISGHGPDNILTLPLTFVPPTASRAQIIVKAYSQNVPQNGVGMTTNGIVRFFPDPGHVTTYQSVSYENAQLSQYAEAIVFLNPKILPVALTFSIFGFGSSGYIPDGTRSPEVLLTYFFLGAYFETL
jgi:hypothetical protein